MISSRGETALNVAFQHRIPKNETTQGFFARRIAFDDLRFYRHLAESDFDRIISPRSDLAPIFRTADLIAKVSQLD